SSFDDLVPDVDFPTATKLKSDFKVKYNELIKDLPAKKSNKEIIEHLKRINKSLESYSKEAKKLAIKGSAIEEHLNNTISNVEKEITSNNSKINKLQELIDNEKQSPTKKIVDAVSKFTTMFTKFLSKEEKTELREMSQVEIYNEATIKLEDYNDAGTVTNPHDKDGKEITNSNVKVTSGLISEKNKGKGIYVYVGDKRIGGLLDPRRYSINGKPFNPGNMNHLQELNPDFVEKSGGKLVPTTQGKAMQDNYKALVAIFEELEKKGSFTNEEVQKHFFVNRTGGFEYLKGIFTVKMSFAFVTPVGVAISRVCADTSANNRQPLSNRILYDWLTT
ncbi:MAG: hypothetical protein WCG10_08480, partial [Chlamydiota bacterium]